MNPHILLVEDEAEIAELIEIALQRAHFTPHYAATAEAANAILAVQAIDLVLLDVGLPDINGFDYLKILRSRHPNIAIIMLTAQDEETDRIIGLELGADDYIGKPFSLREVVARIKAVLRRSQATPENAAPLDWQDDEALHCIRFQGQALPLTLGEYRLLRTLLHRKGRVFSREELLIAMYGEQRPSDPHTINSHIRALRSKLRSAHIDDSCIHTHHGLGYSFQ